jgi:predicted amidohydrolase YtcJ
LTGFGHDSSHLQADLAKSPILKDVPIVLYRIDVHAAWVSPAVLAAMNPIPDTDDEGGKVVRDEHGVPSGIFIDNAMRWHIDPVRPEITDAEREEALNVMTAHAISMGMTGLHDAGQYPRDLEFFKAMAKENKLGVGATAVRC